MTGIPYPVLLTLIYGILSIVGGVIGYQTAGSSVSLLSGGISGALLLIAAYLLSGFSFWGLVLAAVVSLVLVIVFVVRLIKTRKFMPAGLMVIVGVANLISLWLALTAA